MTRRAPLRILVTGFGPFPGVHDNPSGKLVQWLDDGLLRAPAGTEILTTTIPTSWDAVAAFAGETLPDIDPDIALHFGVSRRARGFQVEQVARNTTSNSADCNGATFDQPQLVRGGPARLQTGLNAARLVRDLRLHGLPAFASRDAGTYLCNMLLYLSLREAQNAAHGRLAVFIHIPLLRPGWFGRTELLTGLGVIVKHCASRQRHAMLVA